MVPDPTGPQGPDPLAPETEVRALGEELRLIIDEERLCPHYQTILDLKTGKVHGFEGFIWGPSDSLLHAPLNLFKVAQVTGQMVNLESACCMNLLRAFGASGLHQKLFLNISPVSLSNAPFLSLFRPEGLKELGFTPDRIVIELTENLPVYDFKQLVATAGLFRDLGFAIAMDDLGEGFSRLRLWSELRPEYVKIDKHFICGVSQDPVKQQFLCSLQEIAVKTGARVVAEGIEQEADLAVILDLGLHLGQGYLIGRPVAAPHEGLPPEILGLVRGRSHPPPGSARTRDFRSTAARLLVEVPPVAPSVPNWKVGNRFSLERELQSIPVVKGTVPVGLINRHVFTDLMARPFFPELYGKRPCETVMDKSFLVVDQRVSLPELSRLIVESDPRNILYGFIITRDGQYAGMGSGHDLMREITQMQIHAARYANPLTGLPGNVPINEYLDDLLHLEQPFVTCYCDLDHFKPFNDVHGYDLGDRMIQWTGALIEAICEPDLDFIGHIGGDDFILVLRSLDWERRCLQLLADFEQGKSQFFSEEEQASGGYTTEDRNNRIAFHPLISLSIGAVNVRPGVFSSYHEIAAAVSVAKKEAKRMVGSCLFTERRSGPGETEGPVREDPL